MSNVVANKTLQVFLRLAPLPSISIKFLSLAGFFGLAGSMTGTGTGAKVSSGAGVGVGSSVGAGVWTGRYSACCRVGLCVGSLVGLPVLLGIDFRSKTSFMIMKANWVRRLSIRGSSGAQFSWWQPWTRMRETLSITALPLKPFATNVSSLSR